MVTNSLIKVFLLYFREGRSKKLFPWTPKISSCLEYNTKILVFYNFFRHGGKLLTYIIICNYQLKQRIKQFFNHAIPAILESKVKLNIHLKTHKTNLVTKLNFQCYTVIAMELQLIKGCIKQLISVD